MERDSIFRQTTFFDKDTIETIRVYSEVFEDPSFQCGITSLINFDDNSKLPYDKKEQWLSYEWKRIPEIYKNDIRLFQNASSLDVKQGLLGNCYLLSVCAVIAEFPRRLEQLFTVRELNTAGIYSVKFYIDGQAKTVVIDDRVPYDPITKRPPFSRVNINTKNIWPLLVEKAWAKQLGNYQNTIAGSPFELFKLLTGAPSFHIITDKYVTQMEQSALWKKLQDFYLQNYYICAATHSERGESNSEIQRLMEQIKSIGLSLSHAYSCLFFYQFEASGQILRLVKIRNPWGCLEHSKLQGEVITKNYYNIPDIRKNIGDVNQDGVFILTFEEFMKYFSTVYVCQYSDGYESYSQKIHLSNNNDQTHFHLIKVNLTYAKHINRKIYFSVNKPNDFAFAKEKKIETNLYNSIFVGRIVDSSNPYHIEYVSHKEGFDSSLYVELESYQNSEYILLVHFDRHQGTVVAKNYLGFVSVYTCEENVFFEFVEENDIKSEKLFQNLIYDFYSNFKFSFEKDLKVISEDRDGVVLHNTFQLQKSNYGFILFENLNKNTQVKISISEIQSEDMETKGKGFINTSIKKTYEVVIPQQEFLILSYFCTPIKYKYTFLLMKSRDQLKNQIYSQGVKKELRTPNGKIEYYTLKHDAGICYKFVNNLNNLFQIGLKITKCVNLICYEFFGNSHIEFFIAPLDVYFLYFDIEEGSKGGFNLAYEVSVKLIE